MLVAIAVLGLGVHLWFALGGDALDADRALTLLMARHFADGEWSLFFWQQNYMVALEPLLLTPFALVGLATPITAGIVGIGLTTLLAALSVRLARRLGGAPWMALLFWAVPPALVVHHHVALYGARLAATVIVFVAFTWSITAHSRTHWWSIGLLGGLAYFSDHLMLPWALGVALIAARRGGLRYVCVGAVVMSVLDGAAAISTPAYHLSGPNFPGDWLHNIPMLIGTILPQLFGVLLGRGPGPDWEPAATLVPPGPWWLVFAIPGVVTLVLLAVTLLRHRTAASAATETNSSLVYRALLLVVVAQLILFVFVGGGGEKWSVRYLVPLWPALSVFAAKAAAGWSARRRPLAILALLPATFTLRADSAWPRSGDAASARAEAAAVHAAVRSANLPAVWAEYWDAYRLALLTGETPRWVTYRVIERRPDWVEEARAARPAGYLLRTGDSQLHAALAAAEARGIQRVQDGEVGRFRLVVMARPVPGLEFRNPAPPRSLQMLAAAVAAVLFVATLPVVALLARRPLSR